jgi:hypothetical protein
LGGVYPDRSSAVAVSGFSVEGSLFVEAWPITVGLEKFIVALRPQHPIFYAAPIAAYSGSR